MQKIKNFFGSVGAFLLPLSLLASSKAGAAGAGLTGSLLSGSLLVGQIQAPEGVPTWLAAICVGVGPSVAWLFTRFVASFSALYTVRARVKRARAADLQRLDAEKSSESSGPVIKELLDAADEAEARAAALDAWKLPRTNS